MRSNRLATLATLYTLAGSAFPTSLASTPAYAASEHAIASEISDTSKPWLPPWHGPPNDSDKLWSYKIFFGGIPLGYTYAALNRTSSDGFDLTVNIVLNAFISRFVDFRLWAYSVGTLQATSVELEQTETRIRSEDQRSRYTFTYSDGALVDHNAILNHPDVDHDSDITPRDPTALIVVPRDRRWDAYDPRQCMRMFPIFDGHRRADMILAPVRVRVYDRPRDNTKVLECGGRFKSRGSRSKGKSNQGNVRILSPKKRRHPITVYVMHDPKYDLMVPVLISSTDRRGTATMRMVKVD